MDVALKHRRQSVIVECVVTTQNAACRINVAPMGPRFAEDFAWSQPLGQTFLLRPFEPSQTLENLREQRVGVLNFTDDVLLIAQAALMAEVPTSVGFQPCQRIEGHSLRDAGRCFEFEVVSLKPEGLRWDVPCRILHVEERRSLIVFNRAAHAVIEATILATRIGLLPPEQIRAQMTMLAPLVEKTAGSQQREAWEFVQKWLAERLPPPVQPETEAATPQPEVLPPGDSPANEPGAP